MTHSFDTEIAEKIGVNAAIIYANIEFWCAKNKANNTNFYDNNYWTYNSVKAWKELFPYLGESKIKTALKKLEDDGFIQSGNYNKSAYDRTKWYSLIHLSVLANGNGENGQPIPDNKPDNKPDTYFSADEAVSMWNEFATRNEKSKVLKLTGKRREKLLKRIKELKDYEAALKITLEKASKSSFCLDGKWFSFDWLIENDTNLVKVFEGKYDNEKVEYR